jgi:hypothetical protein
VSLFNGYYETLTPKKQQQYYGGKPSSIADYTGCKRCGKNDFRVERDGDCPVGCTICPVIFEDVT